MSFQGSSHLFLCPQHSYTCPSPNLVFTGVLGIKFRSSLLFHKDFTSGWRYCPSSSLQSSKANLCLSIVQRKRVVQSHVQSEHASIFNARSVQNEHTSILDMRCMQNEHTSLFDTKRVQREHTSTFNIGTRSRSWLTIPEAISEEISFSLTLVTLRRLWLV